MAVRVRVLHEAQARGERERSELGRAIRDARLAAGLRMADVGRAIHRSEAWVSRVERGRLPDVSFVDIGMLAASVGLRLLESP